MKKILLIALRNFVICSVVMYLLAIFVSFNPDVQSWGYDGRLGFLWIVLSLTVIVTMCENIPDNW